MGSLSFRCSGSLLTDLVYTSLSHYSKYDEYILKGIMHCPKYDNVTLCDHKSSNIKISPVPKIRFLSDILRTFRLL